MKGRPAESITGAGAIAYLIAYVAGVRDTETVVVLGAALGLIPAAVTLLVDGGGIRGILTRIWRGRTPTP